MQKIPSSEITPEYLYFSRREFIKNTTIYPSSLSLFSACNFMNVPGNQIIDLF